MSETTPLVLGNVTKPGAVDRLQRAGEAALRVLGPTGSLHIGEVVGDDIASVHADLSGISIASLGELQRVGGQIEDVLRAHGIGEERVDAVHASEGLIRFAEVKAQPLTIIGTDFTLQAALADIPITWLEDAIGRLAIAIDDKRAGVDLTGDLSLSVPHDDFIALLHRVAEEINERDDVPVDIELRQVRLTQESPRSLRIEASAKASKGFVSGTVIARATVEIDHDLTLHVNDVELTSRNPIIAGLLKFADKYLNVDPIRLADLGPLGERILEVTLTVGDNIEAQVILG